MPNSHSQVMSKIGNARNDLRLTCTPYTRGTYPQGPNFSPFRSATSRFPQTMLWKIIYALNDLRLTLNT